MAAPVSIPQTATISAYIPAESTAQWAKHLKACKPLVNLRKAYTSIPILGCVLLRPHEKGITAR